jgi:hypothetical protein
VHSVKKPTSFEEPAQRNARWARSIFFPRKSFELSYSKSRERKVCVGDRNPVKDRSSEEIALFTSVDEIPETDSSGEQRVETFESRKIFQVWEERCKGSGGRVQLSLDRAEGNLDR